MSKSIRETKTEKNLMAAFAGESMTVNRYTYFAEEANREGYEEIAGVFREAADDESAHARVFFRLFEGGSVEVEAAFTAAPAAGTKNNLEAAAAGEKASWSQRYPEFARIAGEEGFSNIADIFESIGRTEKLHEERFSGLLENMEKGEVFIRTRVVRWICTNCGYVLESPKAPKDCPACKRPEAFFEEVE